MSTRKMKHGYAIANAPCRQTLRWIRNESYRNGGALNLREGDGVDDCANDRDDAHGHVHCDESVLADRTWWIVSRVDGEASRRDASAKCVAD